MNDRSQVPAEIAHSSQWHWWLLLALVGVFALGIRLYFVTHAVVFQPANLPKAHGDAVEYYNYARNLVRYGVFSKDPLAALAPHSDSFRDPGYPFFLAALMKAFPKWDSWYAALLFTQAALSAFTVTLWLQVARYAMSLRWLVAAGVVMAIWPHSVAMSSDIMTETLYGFFVALALAMIGVAQRKNNIFWGAFTGICFAMAALTNAVLLPFVVLVPLYTFVRRQMRPAVAATIVATALTLIGPWVIRNTMLPADSQSSSSRIKMNLIQGSWPSYHSAFIASEIHKNPRATVVLNKINNETYAVEASPMNGLSMMYQRMSTEPGKYLLWYLEKPALLWDWSIRIGPGDIYFHVTYNSPYKDNKVWRAVAAICHASNKLIMLLALAGCLLALFGKPVRNELEATALLLLLVTAIHTVLQTEPRYSIPYRGAEIITALFGLKLILANASELRSKTASRRLISKSTM